MTRIAVAHGRDSPGTLLFRADAGPVVGSGHVMRCLALAEAWVEVGGKVCFRTRTEAPSIDNRLLEVGPLSDPTGKTGSEEDAESTAAEARRLGASWVVADGYEFDADFEHRVAAFGGRVLSIDDLGERRSFGGHALLNQNAYADESLYRGAAVPDMRLLGSRYALMRREFRERRDPPREHPAHGRHLLVSMGGGDFRGVSPVVLEALRLLKPEALDTTLLVGPNNPHLAALRDKAAAVGVPVRVEVGTRDMAGWMAWADLAVQAGGSTVWESCFMGLPSLVVCLAENQRRIVESTAAAGAGESLGWYHALTPEALAPMIGALLSDSSRRRAMSEAASRLVDGRGALRVRDAMLREGL